MSWLLLTVADSFDLSGRDTAIAPAVSPDVLGSREHGYKTKVRLVHPNGTEEIAEAAFYWEHFNPGGFHCICFVEDAIKEQVPPGTKIWLLDSDE